MKKIDWVRNSQSRKLWTAVASFVSMMILATGGTDNTATQVTALIMAGASVVAYIIGEGLTDSATSAQTVRTRSNLRTYCKHRAVERLPYFVRRKNHELVVGSARIDENGHISEESREIRLETRYQPRRITSIQKAGTV